MNGIRTQHIRHTGSGERSSRPNALSLCGVAIASAVIRACSDKLLVKIVMIKKVKKKTEDPTILEYDSILIS